MTTQNAQPTQGDGPPEFVWLYAERVTQRWSFDAPLLEGRAGWSGVLWLLGGWAFKALRSNGDLHLFRCPSQIGTA